MAETVFILGAGASHLAGVPVMKDFLDRADELRSLGQVDASAFDLVFDGIAELENTQGKAKIETDNIEEVFGAFEMARMLGRLGDFDGAKVDGLVAALKLLIVQTIETRMKLYADQDELLPPRPYGGFAKLLRDLCEHSNYMRTAVLTFNYDVALEYGLYRYSIPYFYHLSEPSNPNVIDVLKLHGSLSWIRCTNCQLRRVLDFPTIFSTFRSHFVSGNPIPKIRATANDGVTMPIATTFAQFGCPSCSHAQAGAAELVPPTWNKTSYQGDILNVWKRAGLHLSVAKNVVIIGYSFPETDQFFKHLFAVGTIGKNRFKNILVVNPDGRLKPRYEQLLGPTSAKKFEFLAETFEDAIPLIRQRLEID